MIYDGVITKPELTEENMLMHWGVKGMKWKKRLKGALYKSKNKLRGNFVKTNRFIRGIDPETITNGRKILGDDDGKATTYNRNGKQNYGLNPIERKERYLSGIEAGRKRAALRKEENRPRSRKKIIVSGKGSIKKGSKV